MIQSSQDKLLASVVFVPCRFDVGEIDSNRPNERANTEYDVMAGDSGLDSRGLHRVSGYRIRSHSGRQGSGMALGSEPLF